MENVSIAAMYSHKRFTFLVVLAIYTVRSESRCALTKVFEVMPTSICTGVNRFDFIRKHLFFFFFFLFFFFFSSSSYRARQHICPGCTAATGLLCNPKHYIQHRFSSPVLLIKRQRFVAEAVLMSFGLQTLSADLLVRCF
jgi:hypothetical protein